MRAACVLMAVAVLGSRVGAQSSDDLTRIAEILNLPRTAETGRRAGVEKGTIGRILDSLRVRRVPAADAEEILRREVEFLERGDSKDNFGAYVNSQLALGLRGRDLADAIHREQDRRGMGQGGNRPPTRGGAGQGRDDQTPGRSADDKPRAKSAADARQREAGKASADSAKGKAKGRRP